MQGTLRRSFKPILSFSVVMGIAVIAFAQFAHLCFGAKVNLEVSLPHPIMGTLFFFFLFARHIICPYQQFCGCLGWYLFRHQRVGTFMFNFFLNKIKAFHSKIAWGKAQLSHKFLSKAPTMSNSHLFLVIVDTFFFWITERRFRRQY